ncbi:hypothetical protein HG530_008669 [Fusarium avenaceum]|nr:hypothetical protein HG530_008669 [Fusarium avenaceum]
MPEKATVRRDLGKLGVVESLKLTLTLDAEDVLYLVVYVMSRTARLNEIVLEVAELGAVVVERSHLLEAEALELAIKRMDSISRLAINLHDVGCVLHVRQALKKFYFFLERVVVTDNGWSASAKIVRDEGIVGVGKVLSSSSYRQVVLGRGEVGVVHQSSKVLELLKTTSNGCLA